MATGILRIQAFAARQSSPVEGVTVNITGDGFTAVRTTDAEGNAADVVITAPDCALSLEAENTTRCPYAVCSLTAAKTGFRPVRIQGIQIFAGQVTLAQPEMIPETEEDRDVPNPPIVIPPHALFAGNGGSGTAPTAGCVPRVLDRVIIPKNITVHLGKPAASARNVTVSFRNYIANVASSEVYPTWPEAALRANIHCQISLALNRIYTEWYPSKGYNFNITNSTSYDQYYVHGRTVFDVMVRLTDDIFNTYLRKTGTVNPYYSEYCDGKSVTCPGLKQWGTVTLAKQGRTPLQILKYYYGSNIEIVRTNNIQSIPQSYPGSPLRQGDSGTAVYTLQRQLNRITKDYPFLGKLTVDGRFGPRMTATVKAFQKQFGLTADGVVGRQTWYKISYIYVSVKDLAELTSEGETSSGTLSDGTWGGTTLRTGSTGSAVEQLQFWLNTLAQYESSIPPITVDGSYGAATVSAVEAFQTLFGLTPDGVVGRSTWNKLKEVGLAVANKIVAANVAPGQFTTTTREGSSGTAVRAVQYYLRRLAAYYSDVPRVAVDGKFGAATTRAVKAWQSRAGLTVDGVVGRLTFQSLYDAAQALEASGPVVRTVSLPAPAATLRPGDTGAAVLRLNRLLLFLSQWIPEINFTASDTPDSTFDLELETAVRSAQRYFGLTETGSVTAADWKVFRDAAEQLLAANPAGPSPKPGGVWPASALAPGSAGPAVLQVQKWLNIIAAADQTADFVPETGLFDTETQAALESYQLTAGLETLGVVDADTWESLRLAAQGLCRECQEG